ncbi:MAG: IS66 family transposase [Halanaerobiales bacterium]|nr:IS66 family transposase [Halanaerobiales bacterium]
MWLYASGLLGVPIYLHDYQPSRGQEHTRKFLNGFSGYLQTDGYAG